MGKKVSALFAVIVIILIVGVGVVWNLLRLRASETPKRVAPMGPQMQRMRERMRDERARAARAPGARALQAPRAKNAVPGAEQTPRPSTSPADEPEAEPRPPEGQ